MPSDTAVLRAALACLVQAGSQLDVGSPARAVRADASGPLSDALREPHASDQARLWLVQ
jgi:hypothetical protein